MAPTNASSDNASSLLHRRSATFIAAAIALLYPNDNNLVRSFQSNRNNIIAIRWQPPAPHVGAITPLLTANAGTSPSSSSASKDDERPTAAVVLVETDVQIRDRILAEIDAGERMFDPFDSDLLNSYGDPDDDLLSLEDDDDPTALDASTLGQWDDTDLLSKFDYEWDPNAGDADPNERDPRYRYVENIEVDDEGNEVGYDPVFGPSNPIDSRTILNPPDSYVIDERTRDERLVPQDFPDGDPERDANANFVAFRKSLDIIETYTDEHLGMEVPRHTAKWHGHPEVLSYPRRDYTNNRFTRPEDRTDFDALGPARAREVAVQMARAKNNEWLPEGTSEAYHASKMETKVVEG
ncbi:hypothetical protein ACHAXA_009223 [Cyclostephanos tholiformis]|uniref:Uncharacterized protein n=1 Tax=Cyclostephanos tholiformis TaxID=382380 RepID=A0ABD3RU03_9STRA